MSMLDRMKAEQAREQGRAARRAGTPFALCPYRHARDAERRLLADEWRMGWREQDQSMRKAAAR